MNILNWVAENLLTLIFSLIIIIFYVYSYGFTKKKFKNNEYYQSKRKINSFAPILSTLGVLFTFIGIVWGLYNFNTTNISNSISELLNGLKMAFVTSIVGMILSIFMGKVVNNLTDKLEAQNEIQTDTPEISTLNLINKNIERLLSIQIEQKQKVENSLTSILELQKQSNETLETQLLNTQLLDQSTEKIGSYLLQLRENVQDNNKEVVKIHTAFNDTIDMLEAQTGIQNEGLAETKSLAGVIKGEIVVITDAMEKGNQLMASKFDEFSELLKKNNVEALVEVMQTVTMEFNKQMKELINKLVQENFDQLNKSVEQLNSWQQENKQMIENLTSQYTNMTKEFEGTSQTLSAVATTTQTLVKEDGKLQRLISELQKVLIDDKKFTEITERLSDTVDKVQKGTISFEEATRSLNTWINNHRDLGDGVRLLIHKLEEINKIKDYNETFWQGTKKSLNEGVGLISEASERISNSVETINDEFYERLNVTLTNLDACIQAMHDHYSN